MVIHASIEIIISFFVNQKGNEVKVITVYRFLWYDSLNATIT